MARTLDNHLTRPPPHAAHAGRLFLYHAPNTPPAAQNAPCKPLHPFHGIFTHPTPQALQAPFPGFIFFQIFFIKAVFFPSLCPIWAEGRESDTPRSADSRTASNTENTRPKPSQRGNAAPRASHGKKSGEYSQPAGRTHNREPCTGRESARHGSLSVPEKYSKRTSAALNTACDWWICGEPWTEILQMVALDLGLKSGDFLPCLSASGDVVWLCLKWDGGIRGVVNALQYSWAWGNSGLSHTVGVVGLG